MHRDWSAEFLDERNEIVEMLEEGEEVEEIADEYGNVFTWRLICENSLWDDKEREILTDGKHIGDAKEFAEVIEEKADGSKALADLKTVSGGSLCAYVTGYAALRPSFLSFVGFLGGNLLGLKLFKDGYVEKSYIENAEGTMEFADLYMEEQERKGFTDYSVRVTDSREIKKRLNRIQDQEEGFEVYMLRG